MRLAEFLDVGTGGLEDAQPEQTEHGHKHESLPLGDYLEADNRASNWRWLSPNVGDSAGTRVGGEDNKVRAQSVDLPTEVISHRVHA